jgi:hypothetical protein
VGSAQEAIKKEGYFKSYKECSGTFANKHDKIKQLESQLAELEGTSGTSRKSVKNSKETTVEARSTSSTLRADPMAVLKQAVEAADKASAGSNLCIKVKLHLSLRKKSHLRGTSMN